MTAPSLPDEKENADVGKRKSKIASFDLALRSGSNDCAAMFVVPPSGGSGAAGRRGRKIEAVERVKAAGWQVRAIRARLHLVHTLSAWELPYRRSGRVQLASRTKLPTDRTQSVRKLVPTQSV